MEAPIITLTTDWGNKDFFAGIVKGKLYSAIPNLRISDISHGIEPYNLAAAAFVVKNACLGFPPGTIHIIDVDSFETVSRSFIVAQYQNQYFICTDNGLPHAVFGNDCQKIVELSVPQDSDFYTFPALHLFSKVAILLAQDTPIDDLGRAKDFLEPNTKMNFIEQGNRLTAYVLYIDSYGNAYLNISYQEFERIRAGRKFELRFNGQYAERIHEITNSYVNENKEALILTVSATGLLEVAISHDSAEQLLALSPLKKVDIIFS